MSVASSCAGLFAATMKKQDGEIRSESETGLLFRKIPDHESAILSRIFKEIHSIQPVSDTAGKKTLDSLVSETFDASLNQWIKSTKDEYTYNAAGNVTLNIAWNWNNTTGRWDEDFKNELTYNAGGKVVLEMEYVWNASSQGWTNSFRTEYEYDNKGNILSATESSFDPGTSQWVNTFRSEFAGNTNGNLNTDTWFSWDETSGQWIRSYLDEYNINIHKSVSMQISSNWDTISNKWINYMKHEYISDGNNNPGSEIIYNWEPVSGQWVACLKNQYSYDATGNLSTLDRFYRNAATNLWTLEHKEESVYSNVYSFIDLIIPWYYYEPINRFNHMLKNVNCSDYDDNSGVMRPTARGTYYY